MSDEEVHKAALSDPDAQPLTKRQLVKMQRVSFAKRLRWKRLYLRRAALPGITLLLRRSLGGNQATHSRLGRFAESLSLPFSLGVSRRGCLA